MVYTFISFGYYFKNLLLIWAIWSIKGPLMLKVVPIIEWNLTMGLVLSSLLYRVWNKLKKKYPFPALRELLGIIISWGKIIKVSFIEDQWPYQAVVHCNRTEFSKPTLKNPKGSVAVAGPQWYWNHTTYSFTKATSPKWVFTWGFISKLIL